MRQSVERVGRGLGPDDDWMPIAFMVNADQEVAVVATPGWSNDDEKYQFTAALALQAIAHHAVCMGIVATTWMLTFTPDDPEYAQAGQGIYVRPSQSPERKEAVVVMTTTRDVSTMSIAMIKRRQRRHPQLSEWDITDDRKEGARLEGDMLDPLRGALEIVAKQSTAEEN